MDNYVHLDPAQEFPPPPEEKLLRAPTLWEKYGKYRFAIIILLMVFVSLGVYIVVSTTQAPPQPQQAPISLLTPSVEPTANPDQIGINWKTYINTKYNYQLKYPNDWIIEVDGVVVWQNDVPHPELGKQIMFFKRSVHEPYIGIHPYPNSRQLNLKDHLIKEILKPIDFPTRDPKEQVRKMKPLMLVGIEEALEERSIDGAPIVYLRQGSMTIVLSLSYADNPDAKIRTSAKQIFDQILSTFRFD